MLFSKLLFVVADSKMNKQYKPEDYISFLLNDFVSQVGFINSEHLLLGSQNFNCAKLLKFTAIKSHCFCQTCKCVLWFSHDKDLTKYLITKYSGFSEISKRKQNHHQTLMRTEQRITENKQALYISRLTLEETRNRWGALIKQWITIATNVNKGAI